MTEPKAPKGFRWTWKGDVVRVHLPAMLHEGGRWYEPVLARRDAERLADAISERLLWGRTGRGATTPTVALARLSLARDPRYDPKSVLEFRTWLAGALLENGIELPIGETNGTAVIDFGVPAEPSEDGDEPPPSPSEPRSPGAPPRPAPGEERSGFHHPPAWRRRFEKR